MDLILTREQCTSEGVFGTLTDMLGNQIAVTLEHAYERSDGSFGPKIPEGTFECVRGEHQLEGMASTFITFEITGVPGHTGLLFHVGNYNKDSSGCVLLGEIVSRNMITDSLITFGHFMTLQDSVNAFSLTVVGAS